MLTFLDDSQALLLFLAGVGFDLMTSLWAQCIFQLVLLLFCGAGSLVSLRFVFFLWVHVVLMFVSSLLHGVYLDLV